MSCGAVIVASPVGAIPDLIRNGKTGFLIKTNSPQNIASGIIAAFQWGNLEEIAQNAHDLINREYSIASSIDRYKKLVNFT
jgi:glycosyltransferase involved in cell wall biosynthesis